jgi:hypothetical protein
VSSAPTKSSGILINASPYTILYTPLGSGTTATQITEATQVACQHVENFIRSQFTSEFSSVKSVVCTAVASTLNATTISYQLTTRFSSDSSPFPSPFDVDNVIKTSFSEPHSDDLIAKLKGLTGNPISGTAGIAYDVSKRSIQNTVFVHNQYEEKESIVTPITSTTGSTNTIWNICLALFVGCTTGFIILKILVLNQIQKINHTMPNPDKGRGSINRDEKDCHYLQEYSESQNIFETKSTPSSMQSKKRSNSSKINHDSKHLIINHVNLEKIYDQRRQHDPLYH